MLSTPLPPLRGRSLAVGAALLLMAGAPVALTGLGGDAHAHGPQPRPLDFEDAGDLHNAALDYAISQVDPDANILEIAKQLRLGLVDSFCVEYASGFPAGRVPGFGNQRQCENRLARRLFRADREGPVSRQDVFDLLPSAAPETGHVLSLFALVEDAAAERIDIEEFDRRWEALADEVQADDLTGDADDVTTLALSLGRASTHYWHAVRTDPGSPWLAVLARLDCDEPDPSRANWPGIIAADIEAGVISMFGGGSSDHGVFWDAANASMAELKRQ